MSVSEKSGDGKLTANQSLVLEQLRASAEPMTAYGLLDELRPSGLRAPAQIYRALERLTAMGLAHRLESKNAYMPCREKGCTHSAIAVFATCKSCGTVIEMPGGEVEDEVYGLARQRGFEPGKAVIEFQGHCASCMQAA